MKNVAKLSRSEREELFIVTAREFNLPEAMVEKDFWVCWTLDYRTRRKTPGFSYGDIRRKIHTSFIE